MNGYQEIKDLISDIDEFHNEAELREILQEFINLDYNSKIGNIDAYLGLETILCKCANV